MKIRLWLIEKSCFLDWINGLWPSFSIQINICLDLFYHFLQFWLSVQKLDFFPPFNLKDIKFDWKYQCYLSNVSPNVQKSVLSEIVYHEFGRAKYNFPLCALTFSPLSNFIVDWRRKSVLKRKYQIWNSVVTFIFYLINSAAKPILHTMFKWF